MTFEERLVRSRRQRAMVRAAGMWGEPAIELFDERGRLVARTRKAARGDAIAVEYLIRDGLGFARSSRGSR